MVEIVKLTGFKELGRTLDDLPKAVARNMLNSGLKKAAEPVRAKWEALAPRETGRYAASIIVGKRLTRRQQADAKKDTIYFAEQHVGSSNPAAIPQEYGTVNHPAQPSGRPAWDAEKDGSLDILKKELWASIERRAKRTAKKAAKG